jgi:biopolymer transport protein ExbB/TolQ
MDIIPSGQETTQSLVPLRDRSAPRPAVGTGIRAPVWLAAVIAVGVTVLLYALVFYPLHDRYLGQLMTERGPIQYELVLVTSWGLALLGLRYLAVKRELRSTGMELQLIPLEIGMQIAPTNVDQFLGHLARLPENQQRSVLARRIRGALEHFKHRNNVSEVQTYLTSQAQLDGSAVDSGYTLLRVFIWLCPILGFIGTVTGISDAVTGLAQSLPKTEAAAPLEPGQPAAAPAEPAAGEGLAGKMLKGMETVTNGLAVAFDTTFLGLLCVVILVFPYEALKKIEYGALDRVEEFANESLLRRMAENEDDGVPEMPGIVRDALEAAFREHQRWLTEWQAQVRQLGQVIGGDFEQAAGRVAERISRDGGSQLQELQRAAKAVDDLFGKLVETRDGHGMLSGMERLSQAMITNNSLMTKLIDQQSRLLPPTSIETTDGMPPDGIPPPDLPPLAEATVSQSRASFFGRIFGRGTR